jgi:DNA-directed RNA polymerase subunit M/transcription elongation factor TFIIS
MTECTCEFCGQNEMTFEQYTQHVKDEHGDIMNEKKVSCMRCGDEDFPSILHRINSDDEFTYLCNNCYDDQITKVR